MRVYLDHFVRGIFNITIQFELFGMNHRSAKSHDENQSESSYFFKKREREKEGKSFYLTLTGTKEEKENGPLILEKILFSAHLESHF